MNKLYHCHVRQIDALTPISANTNIRLAITAAGTTYPGTDLSVFVYS
jgi:hypothetical protein